jgi:hypothetical protein
MIPSIHPYGDIWLHTTPQWDFVRQLYHSIKSTITGAPSPLYKPGDIVIWKDPPNQNNNGSGGRRACKRIVGIAGDTVQRYGQFAEYYRHRPDIGVRWDSNPLMTRGLDPSCPWDTYKPSSTLDLNTHSNNQKEGDEENGIYRTLIVPEGHVWLEGDNPLLSVDSRHYGPIPVAWLQGKLVWRIWPLLRHPAIRKHDQLLLRHRKIRPKPLDLETIPDKRQGQEDRLALYYNLHRPKLKQKPPATNEEDE